jgi:hypothetical protein
MNANNNQTPKTNGQSTIEPPFSEAPASWNTRYMDPSGFECQITLRGETGKELLEKAHSAIAFLLETGCTPFVYRPAKAAEAPKNNGSSIESSGNGNGNGHKEDDPAWCQIHQCEMKRWDKNSRLSQNRVRSSCLREELSAPVSISPEQT